MKTPKTPQLSIIFQILFKQKKSNKHLRSVSHTYSLSGIKESFAEFWVPFFIGLGIYCPSNAMDILREDNLKVFFSIFICFFSRFIL